MRKLFFTLCASNSCKLLILREGDFHFMREPTNAEPASDICCTRLS